MTRKYTQAQLKTKFRQIEQKQKHAINNYKRAVNNYNRELKKAINCYNTVIRKHNANVRHNKQLIERELRKLRSTGITSTNYYFSSRQMQQCYEAVASIYHEGVSVTPVQSRILDLIEQEQANSLTTENYIENGFMPEETAEEIEIGNKLALVSEELNSRWNGALFALNPKNPDATRHFCTSTREIFNAFLDIKAPDHLVFSFNPDCQKTERGNATRREKIKYIMRQHDMNDSVISFAESDIKNILDLNQLLSGGTHGTAGKYSFEHLLQVKKRVEQGIVFLCEISR
ncbi:MAG: hypothetical protein IJP92_02540 [Lachnospiraceae bacterium]|nr:hypothetical protein [Lachnospiraceae bacterium]